MRFLVFEIWSILYSTVVNSELETCEKSGRDFCERVSDANQFRLGSSIQKHAGSSFVGGCVGVACSEVTTLHF